jgi:hypothetical protein
MKVILFLTRVTVTYILYYISMFYFIDYILCDI